MSKTKLALDVASDLRNLANSIEILVKAMGSDEVIPKEKVSKTKVEKMEKIEPITIEKVRAVLAEKAQAGKQPEVKALITKFGANKLTDIAQEKYKELLKEAEVL